MHVPLIGDFHFNGHKLLKEHPACAAGAGQVPHQSRQRRPRQQARPAIRRDDRSRLSLRQTGAHRRELGQPRPGPADATDGRELAARRSRWMPNEVMREAIVRLGAGKREAAPKSSGCRHDRIIISAKVSGVQDLIAVYRNLACALRLPAASRSHRSGHGLEGHRRVHGGDGGAAAGRHRRHDSRLAHAGAGRRSHARSHRRAGDPADHGPALVHADGGGVPRLRAHHQHVFPGTGAEDPVAHPPAHAGMAQAVRGRGRHDGRGDGLRGEWPRREQARQHRHQSAGHGRAPGRAGLCRRRERP